MFINFIITALVCIIISYALFSYWSNREFNKKLSKIKSEPSLPFIGHAHKLGSDNTKFLHVLKDMWNNLGRDKFVFKYGPLQQIVLTKPEDVEVILSSNTIIEKNFVYKFLDSWIGDGLVSSAGDKWRVHRRILTPAFHFKILESYVSMIEDYGKIMVKDFLQRTGEQVELIQFANHYAIYTLSRAALGFNAEDNDDLQMYIESSMTLKSLLNSRIFSSWKIIEPLYQLTSDARKVKRCMEILRKRNIQVLNKKRDQMKDVIDAVKAGETSLEALTEDDDFISKKKLTFIELLLLSKKPDGTPLSNDEIIDEVRTFTAVGHETVAAAMAFTLFCLAKNPEVQQMVYEEQVNITAGDLNKPITHQSMQEMKYLERVIKESLRMYPSVVMFGRKLNADVTLRDGTELPAGCLVLLTPYLSHQNSEYFPQPERFDPDRFLDVKRKPYAYFPFSAGPRNCIGQRLAILVLKCWLAQTIRSVELLYTEQPEPHIYMEIIIKSLNDPRVIPRPRKRNI